MKNKMLLFLFLKMAFIASCQPSDIGNWFVYFGNQKLKNGWILHHEFQYRNYNFVGDLQQLVIRTGIGYNLSESNNNLLVGYAYFHSSNYLNDSDDKKASNEHRIFQQFITRQNFGRIFIQHRYRFEQRMLEPDFRLRFRYFLGINIPLNKKILEKKALYASLYNEIFLNTKSPIFDRNRLYGALGYVFGKNIRLEAGYMAQSLESSNRNQCQIILLNNF